MKKGADALGREDIPSDNNQGRNGALRSREGYWMNEAIGQTRRRVKDVSGNRQRARHGPKCQRTSGDSGIGGWCRGDLLGTSMDPP